MLRIKVELVPFGNEEWAKEIGRIKIGNDGTGNSQVGNYDVILYQEDLVAEAIEADPVGTIENIVHVKDHHRKQSVWALVAKALKELGF